jgi:DNA-binding transcriptional MerR regulator
VLFHESSSAGSPDGYQILSTICFVKTVFHMKVSELSERSGVPLPTIKFYIREGLLPAGAATGRNQANYTVEHLERLALIRALRDDAGLGVTAIARALKAADESRTEFAVAAIDAIERPSGANVDETSRHFAEAVREELQVTKARGWAVSAEDRSVKDAARALVVIQRGFPVPTDGHLEVYADAAATVANVEIPDGWRPEEAPNAALRYAVLGTVLFEPFLLALRRAAHVSRSRLIRDGASAPKVRVTTTPKGRKRGRK